MKDVKQKSAKWKRVVHIALIALSSLVLVLVFVFLFMESRWAKPKHLEKHEAFLRGSTGTEIMPLAVFQVLPDCP